MIERLVAVDWSGDKGPGQRKKIWAGVWTRGKVTLESGRSREELIDWLVEMARETPRMVVSIDCCFSYPAWFLAEHGCATVFDFWRHVAAGHGERWLHESCEDARFWGRKGSKRDGKTPAEFRGDDLPRMMRRTDMENKIEQALEGGDPERAAKMKGIQAKSPFQIGGAGAVGTGSLRAMPWLLKLWESGFRVWPFEAAQLDGKQPQPLLVEMYTRLLTGAVKKSNAEARKAYLKERKKTDALYAGLSRGVIANAQGSEDGFDALVCCIEMVRWQEKFSSLKATLDPVFGLEGITWRPGVLWISFCQGRILSEYNRRRSASPKPTSQNRDMGHPELWRSKMAEAAQPDRFGFLHIDLNSFFASVEQQLHPEYRGKPVGVCGTMADTGALIAASYEAKALGIKTLTKVGEAKRICPEIILVSGSHTQYSEFSHKIAAAVERCCPVAHTPSIDEMVCQLMGRERELPNARRIALEIKQAIKDDVGETLRCSIGMAPNRYLAKIASDMQKPDGLIGLLPSQLPRAIAHLELRDLPGVGAKTEKRLNSKGIRTMEQLLALDRPGMHKLWDSVWGDRLYHWLRGADTGDDGAPVPTDVQKSLGHSHVLGPEFRSDEGAWSVAHKLLHKASMRLRMEKFYCGSLAVSVKYALTREQMLRVESKQHSSGIQGTSWGMEARFPEVQDTLSLLDVLRKIWAKRPQGAEYAKPFFVGVTLRELMPEADHQAGLFGDPDNRNQLSATMDKLNLKYGHSTLHFAGMLPARETAPTRIAFTQIPVQYGTDWM